MTEEFGPASPPQASYRRILDRITRSLDNTTHNVLNLAAVLGHRLNDLSMYAIVDLSAGQTMGAMAGLVNRRVLRDGNQGLEFVNEMVRAAAYVGVPPTLRRILHGNIADRFINDRNLGAGDRGLEIAWHCIRAGRCEEATPYLLRGAREAILAGVPHAAERGLSTALPGLAAPDRAEALTLLAEALQEQSKWDESLVVLQELERSANENPTNTAFILATRARRRLGYIDSAELAALPARLLDIMGSHAENASRIQAAVEAASIVNTTRYRSLTPVLLETVSSLGGAAVEINDVTQLLLAQSMLLYNIRDFNSSLNCIARAMSLLQKRHAVNSVLASLQTGTGAILSAQGDYAAATAALLQSHNTAFRVGNDRIHLQASGNLALAFARLGEYEKAIEWADRTLEVPATCIAFPVRLQAAQGAVLANAMLLRTRKAEELITRRAEEFASQGFASVSQAWALYSADGYAMLGMWREAETEGLRATTGENSEIHSDFCVGAYARWVARGSMRLGNVVNAQSRLATLEANLSNYDAIDQAEVLNATSWLDLQGGKTTSPRLVQMHSHLQSLPAAISEQLKRMRMLTSC